MPFITPAGYYHPSSGLQAPLNISPRHSNLKIPRPPPSPNQNYCNKRHNPDHDRDPIEKYSQIYEQQTASQVHVTYYGLSPKNILTLQQSPPHNSRQDKLKHDIGNDAHEYPAKQTSSYYEYHGDTNANHGPRMNHSLGDDNSHHNHQYDHTDINLSPHQSPVLENRYHNEYHPDSAEPTNQLQQHSNHIPREFINYTFNTIHPTRNISNHQYGDDSGPSDYQEPPEYPQEPPEYPQEASIGIDNKSYTFISTIIDKIITPDTETNFVTKKDLFGLLHRVSDLDEVNRLDSLVSELYSLLPEDCADAETTEALLEALEQLTNYLEETVPAHVVTINPNEFLDTYDEQTLSVFVQREGDAKCKKLLHMKKYACWLDPSNHNIIKMKRLIVTKKPHGFTWDNVGIISVDVQSSFIFDNKKLFKRFIELVGRGKINMLPTPLSMKCHGNFMNSMIMRAHILKGHKSGFYIGCRCEFYEMWEPNKKEKIWLKVASEELMPFIVGTKIKVPRKGHKWGTSFSKAKYFRLSQKEIKDNPEDEDDEDED